MPRKTITHDDTFKDYPIGQGMSPMKTENGFDRNILERCYQTVNRALERHCKILLCRFDVRFPFGYPPVDDNRRISHFIDNFCKYLNRKGLDARFVWAREQTDYSDNPHYHVVVLLDGNRTQSIMRHLEVAERCWGQALGCGDGDARGLVEKCFGDYPGRARNGIMIMRVGPNDSDEVVEEKRRVLEEAFNWMSYLAKLDGKENTPINVRRFDASRH